MLLITWYFSGMMDEYHEEKMRLQERVWELENDCGFTEANKIAFDVTVTTYNPTRQQCDSTPNITADGTRINPKKATQYRYVALSRDLIARWGGPFDYGDYIVIEGTGKWDGVYQVRDTMNPKWVKRVDILTTNSKFRYDNITMYKYTNEEYLITEGYIN
jgi:3D (Asp-Asp-Asp) domain-containing protein|tara:strand:+ start:896 stop:1375 length:480 start_codon:yes stop_codon:yes gene_type:complete